MHIQYLSYWQYIGCIKSPTLLVVKKQHFFLLVNPPFLMVKSLIYWVKSQHSRCRDKILLCLGHSFPQKLLMIDYHHTLHWHQTWLENPRCKWTFIAWCSIYFIYRFNVYSRVHYLFISFTGSIYPKVWRFPEIGLPPVIHFSLGLSLFKRTI